MNLDFLSPEIIVSAFDGVSSCMDPELGGAGVGYTDNPRKITKWRFL